ncbi:MAG: type II toxin-antitoxin system HipA family toxin YjjJ [Rubrivivax sp.]
MLPLVDFLRRRGRQPAGALAEQLGISRATLMRAVRAAGDELVVRGAARRTQYAARRALRGQAAPLPVYRVDAEGTPRQIAWLHLTAPDGSALEMLQPLGWPLDEAARDGWFDGLPYPLQDLRPQGFLGRAFARHHAATLQVAEDPAAWSDDDTLHALSLLGEDAPGDLIVGEAACRRWLQRVRAARAGEAQAPLREAELAQAYPALADAAMAAGLPGSSAGGEFPKFTAWREGADGRPQAVLVKFSGSDDSPGTRRWSDLLVCEHLAGGVLAALGLAAAVSRIVQAGGRTFLEVERFDRHGALGRSGLVSWGALNGECFGLAGRSWAEAGRALAARGWLSADEVQALARLWQFGRLLANTDMHDGNLSFRPGEAGAAPLAIAPVYDMLPMLYAPARGVELPPREYRPELPLPQDAAAWQAAAPVALAFWQRAAADERISAGFRSVCAENVRRLAALLG